MSNTGSKTCKICKQIVEVPLVMGTCPNCAGNVNPSEVLSSTIFYDPNMYGFQPSFGGFQPSFGGINTKFDLMNTILGNPFRGNQFYGGNQYQTPTTGKFIGEENLTKNDVRDLIKADREETNKVQEYNQNKEDIQNMKQIIKMMAENQQTNTQTIQQFGEVIQNIAKNQEMMQHQLNILTQQNGGNNQAMPPPNGLNMQHPNGGAFPMNNGGAFPMNNGGNGVVLQNPNKFGQFGNHL